METGPKYKMSVKKRALERQELEEMVATKFNSLAVSVAGTTTPLDIKKSSLKNLVQTMALRPTTGNPDLLDQRCNSSADYAGRGVTRNTTSTPESLKKTTSGKQGTQRYDRDAMAKYHNEQVKLFELLKKEGALPPGIVGWDKKGFLLMCNENGARERLSTSELCDVIDAFSLTCIKDMNDKTVDREKMPTLSDVFDCCDRILRGRFAASLATVNDLMKEEEYKEWRKHMWVIASFGALMVILDMHSKSLYKSSLLEQLKQKKE